MTYNCLNCGNPIGNPLSLTFILSFKGFKEPILCKRCEPEFNTQEAEEHCPHCCRFGEGEDLCSDCQKWKEKVPFTLVNRSLYSYQRLQPFMEKFKFQGDFQLKCLVQQQFSTFINKQCPADFFIVPIPLSPSSLQKRGFNQVEAIMPGINYEKLLSAFDDKRIDQSKRDKAQRMHLKQPFFIAESEQPKVKGAKICLIDDVYTTGTTLHRACELLYRFGAQTVRSITLCR